MLYCSRRRVPALTSFRTTSIAGEYSRNWCADWKPPTSSVWNHTSNPLSQKPRQEVSVSPCLRGEIGSHGKADQRRPVAVRGDLATGFCRAGDGVQRVGGDSERALPLGLFLPSATTRMGDCRIHRHAGRDED